MNTWLDRMVNVAILLACVMVIGLVVGQFQGRLPGGVAQGRVAAPRTSYVKGDRMAELTGVDFSRRSKTLVLFMRSTCQYCVNSMEFYRTIASTPTRDGTDGFQLVVAGPESVETLKNFVRQHRLAPDHVVSVQETAVRIFAMPTLVMTDRRGIVNGTWVGQLPEAGRATVFEALRKNVS